MTRDGCKVFIPVQENAGGKKVKDPYEPKAAESEEMGQWRLRMGKEESKVIYKRRAASVELFNANVRGWGLYQIAVRGLTKAKGIASMFAVAYNMTRTLSARRSIEELKKPKNMISCSSKKIPKQRELSFRKQLAQKK